MCLASVSSMLTVSVITHTPDKPQALSNACSYTRLNVCQKDKPFKTQRQALILNAPLKIERYLFRIQPHHQDRPSPLAWQWQRRSRSEHGRWNLVGDCQRSLGASQCLGSVWANQTRHRPRLRKRCLWTLRPRHKKYALLNRRRVSGFQRTNDACLTGPSTYPYGSCERA